MKYIIGTAKQSEAGRAQRYLIRHARSIASRVTNPPALEEKLRSLGTRKAKSHTVFLSLCNHLFSAAVSYQVIINYLYQKG